MTIGVWVAALAGLAIAGALHAHHSGSLYQTTPVWIRGTVVGFENSNPHTVVLLEETAGDSQRRRWGVEGPGRGQLDRMGLVTDIPEVGEFIEFCAFPYKSTEEVARLFPGADLTGRRFSTDGNDAAPRFVAGHVMVKADGDKQFWEPHGLLSECMRGSDDARQSWLDFLNANTRARQGWCQQSNYTVVRSSESLTAFVEDITNLLGNPCR
jgi:hypothetical protein